MTDSSLAGLARPGLTIAYQPENYNDDEPPAKPRRRKEFTPPREALFTGKFRARYGIPPKGAGPHLDREYALPVPPEHHPQAKAFARAALVQAKVVGRLDGRYSGQHIAEQVRKANTLLYGSPAPTLEEVKRGRAKNRAMRSTFPNREAAEPVPIAPGQIALPGVQRTPITANVQLSESGLQSLREATDGPEGTTPKVARVCIIRAGPGNLADRHFYTEAALQKAVALGLFNGTQCYLDHPTPTQDREQPERSVKNLAGWFSDARMEQHDDPTLGRVPAVVADFHLESGNEIILSKMRTAAQYATQHPKKSYVGFSINALGGGAPDLMGGEEWNRVDEITEVLSVDLVTKSGAGGKPLVFRESAKMPTDGIVIGVDQAKLATGIRGLLTTQRDAVFAKVKEAGITDEVMATIKAALVEVEVDDNALATMFEESAAPLAEKSRKPFDDEDEPDEDDAPGADTSQDDQDDDDKKKARAKAAKAKADAKKKESEQPPMADESETKTLREAVAAKDAENQKLREALHEGVVGGVLAELNIPANFRPRLEIELRERQSLDRQAMVDYAKAFDLAYIRPIVDGAGAVGRAPVAPKTITAPTGLSY